MGSRSLMFLIVLNSFLAITATLCNAVILAALNKVSSLHPPSKILLRSLALTDLGAGILVEPLFVIFLMTAKFEKLNLCYPVLIIGSFAGLSMSFVSLLTLTAISVDRLLALLLGLRYRQVVTSKRVLLSMICFWILSVGLFLTQFLNGKIVEYCISIAVPLCLVVSTCCYTKIYLKLHHHQAQIQEHVHQGQPNGHEPLNIARYRKTVSTALWVQFLLLACYLPFAIVIASMAISGLLPSIIAAWTYSTTLLFFNSTLNPILYCWKIREVRRVVEESVREMLCCL